MGLIRLRNPLVFPGARPGFNPNHIASGNGIRYTGVAGNGTFINILNGSGATIHSTVTNSMIAVIGPSTTITTAGAFLSTPGVNETPLAVTFGFIFRPISTAANGVVFANDGNAFNTSAPTFVTIASLTTALAVNGTTISLVTSLTAGVPYFIAVSFNGLVANSVALNLSTGKVTFKSVASTQAIGTTTNSQYNIGGFSVGNVSNANIATAMYSVNNYLSQAELLQWAQDPWDFWYPPTVGNLLISGLRGLSAISATAASTWQPSDAIAATQTFAATAASVWQPSDAISAALSQTATAASVWQPSDAIVASQGVSATVASVWKPSDAIAATQTLPITASVASVWQPTDSAVVIDTPPAPQPGPQIAFPLRERTYRRRFLGVGYDPQFVITKDRPGPIRIIEFVGEMKDE